MIEWVSITPDHGTILHDIHQRSFEVPWSFDAFQSLFETLFQGWIAYEGDVYVGFILFRLIGDESEILTLAVLPEKRNKGIGRFLVDRYLSFLRSQSLGDAFLEVDETNEGALRLYESAGFEHVGIRLNYYKHSDGRQMAAKVMRWKGKTT